MLLGEISPSELKKAPYSEWFVAGYESYTINDASVEGLKSLLDGVHIKIFMGTWCSDSRREVPRLFKILDAVKFPSEDIQMIAVNRAKTTPEHLEKGFDVLRVPTIIFYKDGEELGRIVEYPIASLEADMQKILSGAEYEHAYAQ